MRNPLNKYHYPICCNCKQEIPYSESHPDHHKFCDGCGNWLCNTCHRDLGITHVSRPTAIGRSGYLVLCRACKNLYSGVTVEEHPFVG